MNLIFVHICLLFYEKTKMRQMQVIQENSEAIIYYSCIITAEVRNFNYSILYDIAAVTMSTFKIS